MSLLYLDHNPSASPIWLQEIIVFAGNTGLRQSEILNLQWCNVDLFRRTITLLEKKNGGRDTLPVNAKTLGVLKWSHENGWIHCRFDG